jgi:hypothetical protein
MCSCVLIMHMTMEVIFYEVNYEKIYDKVTRNVE